MKKLDFNTNELKDYDVPKDWNCPIFCDFVWKEFNCASCGKLVKYGNMFKSIKLYYDQNIPLNVCRNCCIEEILEKEQVDKTK